VIPLGTSSVDVDVGDRNGCDDITGGKSKMSSTATNATSLIVRVSHIVQLVVLEVQWAPDCDHAVKQRPLFYSILFHSGTKYSVLCIWMIGVYSYLNITGPSCCCIILSYHYYNK